MLYVTICESNCPAEVFEKLTKDFPEARIKSLPNKGMDIAPFLWVLNDVGLRKENYSCILKLHGKKSLIHQSGLGNKWRTELVDALLRNKDIFNHYAHKVSTHSNLMIAASNWIITNNVTNYEQQFFSEPLKFKSYTFVGGTMFLVDFSLIMNWFISEKIFERFNDQLQESYAPDGTMAHKIERIFGCIVHQNGGMIEKA
jgi:lipopolysaccharide biosynthesis protein